VRRPRLFGHYGVRRTTLARSSAIQAHLSGLLTSRGSSSRSDSPSARWIGSLDDIATRDKRVAGTVKTSDDRHREGRSGLRKTRGFVFAQRRIVGALNTSTGPGSYNALLAGGCTYGTPYALCRRLIF
jgi:hypothetical protein